MRPGGSVTVELIVEMGSAYFIEDGTWATAVPGVAIRVSAPLCLDFLPLLPFEEWAAVSVHHLLDLRLVIGVHGLTGLLLRTQDPPIFNPGIGPPQKGARFPISRHP